MTSLKFDQEITALLLIDPYNDFISEGGKLWDRVKTVAEANDCISHLLQLLTAARKTGVRVFYAMHHRYRPGDYETWKYAAPIQKAAWSRKTFEYGTWGGEFRADASADYSEEFMHAVLVSDLPNYASAIVTTQEVTDALSGSRPLEQSSSAMGATRG